MCFSCLLYSLGSLLSYFVYKYELAPAAAESSHFCTLVFEICTMKVGMGVRRDKMKKLSTGLYIFVLEVHFSVCFLKFSATFVRHIIIAAVVHSRTIV